MPCRKPERLWRAEEDDLVIIQDATDSLKSRYMTDLEKTLSDPALTREKLLDLFAEAIRSTQAGVEVSLVAPGALRIMIDGKEQTAYFDNLWRQLN